MFVRSNLTPSRRSVSPGLPTACLASEGNIPGFSLTAAADALFGVYQDWVHQNPDKHLDGVINGDDKC